MLESWLCYMRVRVISLVDGALGIALKCKKPGTIGN